MTDTCYYCGIEIMKSGNRWYNKRTADITGLCHQNPDGDYHTPTPVDE